MVELSRDEIARRGLADVWHGEFTEDLTCYSNIAGTFVIPKGFVTDGASIPPIFWNILSDTSPQILYPAFAHDFLYASHGRLPGRILNRQQCDAVIREEMREIGAPPWKYESAYAALRAFGGVAWNRPTARYKFVHCSR